MDRDEFKGLLVGDRVRFMGREGKVITTQTEHDWDAWRRAGSVPGQQSQFQYTWAVELTTGDYIKLEDSATRLGQLRRIN